MEISMVKVMPVEDNAKLKAYVTIELNGRFAVKDLKVIKGQERYFVAMPAKKMRDGTYVDLFHPLDKATRDLLESMVLDEYERVVAARDAIAGRSEVTSRRDVPGVTCATIKA